MNIKTFFINLDSRLDRLHEITNELRTRELDAERFSAIHHTIGFIGCTQSHIELLRLIVERGYENTLIFEDDFAFNVSKEEFAVQFETFFELHKDYDCVMLSYNHISPPMIEDSVVSRVTKSATASGYMVSKTFAPKLLKCLESALPLLIKTHCHWLYMNDSAWFPLQPDSKWYAFNTRIGYQRPSFSNISNINVDSKGSY